MHYYQKHVFICTNQKEGGKKCCAQGGGEQVFLEMKRLVKELNMHGPNKVRISRSGCLGRCQEGPCVVIYPEGKWLTYRNSDEVKTLVDHILYDKYLEPENYL